MITKSICKDPWGRPNKSQNNGQYENCLHFWDIFGSFLDLFGKMSKNHFIKYNEAESDIRNNNLLYKIEQQCQNTFEHLENIETFQTIHFFQSLGERGPKREMLCKRPDQDERSYC